MFNKILIANRGEIACRIMRTARRLGVGTVAVYAAVDANALHVRSADEAFLIGDVPPREAYLCSQRILDIARQCGAEAIHPGYGFLSENEHFAAACADAGLVFIGPPASAIAAMGSKSAAKALMAAAGVPVLPGYHGLDQDDAVLRAAADQMGYPILIKPAAGGGGKGMKIVTQADNFAAQLASAQREAAASFGSAQVLLETYLTKPRHIEIQIFADSQGNVVHLFERDCSIQRRHQKVLEEAPAPGLSSPQRAAIAATAVRAAQAVGYVGAGTVEFIFDTLRDQFYFMEMNTRLQVEHPVTEMISGEDLVEWQLRVASGEPLPKLQDAITCRGHAFEVRLYAEDPARDFLPATGVVQRWHYPADSPHVRVDTGIANGDAMTPYFDPMLAKLIVWDESRPRALQRLARALQQCSIVGLVNNLSFLQQLAQHPALSAGELDTGFIARHRDSLLPPLGAAEPTTLALAALATLLQEAQMREAQRLQHADPHSPWWQADGWQMQLSTYRSLHFRQQDLAYEVVVQYQANGYTLELAGQRWLATATLDGEKLIATLNGARQQALVFWDGAELTLIAHGKSTTLLHHEPMLANLAVEQPLHGDLRAPMPGTVVALAVQTGDDVAAGAALLTLEAMKMEYVVIAPRAGVVGAVFFAVGDQVQEGTVLLTIDDLPVASEST